jgi:hypothetical protein
VGEVQKLTKVSRCAIILEGKPMISLAFSELAFGFGSLLLHQICAAN